MLKFWLSAAMEELFSSKQSILDSFSTKFIELIL